MPRGSLRHVKVLNFSAPLMPVLVRLGSAQGETDYKDMQTQNYSPPTPLRVYETFSLAQGWLVPRPHNITKTVLYSTAKGVGNFLFTHVSSALAFLNPAL